MTLPCAEHFDDLGTRTTRGSPDIIDPALIIVGTSLEGTEARSILEILRILVGIEADIVKR